jgi:Cof subfamily protein (haloacid dehalogenase superfamily)
MKLIAIDLDGTLLNNEGHVSEVTAEIITEVRNMGHKVVIATGRHTNSALPIAEQLGLTDAIVCFNGALVMNLTNRQVEISHSYIQNDINILTKLIRMWGYSFITSTQHGYQIESQYGHLIDQFKENGAQLELVNSFREIADPVLKTMIVGEEQELDEIERFIQPTVPHLQVVRSSEESIDVMNSKASKGAALEWLANHYQVKREDTISIGNYYNDVSMLTYAGIGVAVDNAPDPVKQQADIIACSNEENGVARFLEEHLLRKVYARA